MNSLPWFSASKIKCYEECASQYVAKYVLKMPQPLTSWGVVGLAVHKAIQLAYTENKFPYDTARDYIRKEYQTKYDGKEYVGWGESAALNKAYAMLDNVPFDDFVPMDIEREFILPFPAENPICNLHGYIDIDTVDLQVADWKTGSKIPTRKESLTQLSIYYFAFTQIYHTEPSEVFIVHLPTGKKIFMPIDKMQEKLAELEITIQEMIKLSTATEVTRCSKCSVFCPLHNEVNNV